MMNKTIARLGRAFSVLLLLTLSACGNDDDATDNTPPNRDPYVGEWAGALNRTGLGKEDDIELSVALGSAAANLDCSVLYKTDGQRADFTAIWNRARGGFEATVNGSSVLVSPGSNALRFDQTTGNASFTATLTDARNLWVGNWTGTLACVSGSEANVAWTIQKGPNKADLRITSTAQPSLVLGTPTLTKGVIKGEFADGAARVYTYEADYVDFTGIINVGATARGTGDDCSLALAK